MSNKRNIIWRDTTDLMVYGHEGWLEMTSSHGHEGEDFEVHFKWGHNMKTDGLARKEGIKAWVVTPAGEEKEVLLADGSMDYYTLNFPTPVDGYYQLVTTNTGNFVLSKDGKHLRGTRREHPDAAQAIYYNQYAQVFVPVGHDIEGVPPRLDTPLEIIAPIWKQWRAGNIINLQLLFRGEPLDGVAVDMACNGPSGYRQWQEMTDSKGGICLTARDPGYHLMVVRHRVPEGKAGVYDDTSFTATLWFMVVK
jgi:uncharacterized GH25 family protein